MAAYNAGRFVGDALASLSAQTLGDLEVLVADDGSTDDTAARVLAAARTDPRIRLLRLARNQGQATALNAALDAARGRYLAILDADDLATPTRLAAQVAAFERAPELVLVGGAVRTFQDGRPERGALWRYACDDGTIRARNLFKTEFISSALTFDRERLAAHRLRFDPRYRIGNDWDLGGRAMRVGAALNLPEIVLHYRLHGAQMTAGMMDDVRSDSARIRLDALGWLGVTPSEAELRVHLAVSPCNYWPFGAHPYFAAAGPDLPAATRCWFARLTAAAAVSGRVPLPALAATLADIEREVDVCLAGAAAVAAVP
jgi:glycosyltransferase involved in cell wall biosynthesis